MSVGIRVSDIKLLESQRMTDDPDAGGAPTSQAVEDGESNNIFPDVSRLDRAYGRVSMRKVFGAVTTAHTETYHGAHAIVGDRPSDDNVQILLFDTGGSMYDQRQEARNHVEAYLIPAELRRYHIYGEHLDGMSSLQVSAPTGERLPTVGETLALEHDDGSSDYVRVAGMSSVIEEHTDGGQTFRRRTITIDTSRPLPRNFPGVDPTAVWENHGSPVTFRGMRVADASRYYGANELRQAVAAGAQYLDLRDIYAQIVPTTEREEIASDQGALADMVMDFDAGGETVEVPTHAHTFFLPVTQETRGFSWTAYLRPRPEPGTLKVYWSGLGNWEQIADEDGDGALSGRGSGTVNYENGAVVFTTLELPDAPSNIMLQWGSPAEYIDRSGRTLSTANRPPMMVQSIGDAIAPGTVTVKWLSGDTEQVATDDGNGNLTGDGTGRVVYTRGDIGIAPNFYPDPGTQVRMEYEKSTLRVEVINPADYSGTGFIPAGAAPGDGLSAADGSNANATTFIGGSSINAGLAVSPITLYAAHPPIRPGTLLLRWTVGRGTDFREHFQDFSSHEHALKTILAKDRQRTAEVPVGVTEGTEFDLPGGAREVLSVVDAQGSTVPGEWYEVVHEDQPVDGYRSPSKLEFQPEAMEPEQEFGTGKPLEDTGVSQAEPGGVYEWIPDFQKGRGEVTGIATVVVNAGITLPSTYYNLITGDVKFWLVESLQVGTAQTIPFGNLEAVRRVEDANGYRVPADQWTADVSAGTFTLTDDQLTATGTEQVTHADSSPAYGETPVQEYIETVLDAHTSGGIESVETVRIAKSASSDVVIDARSTQRAGGTSRIRVWNKIQLAGDEELGITYIDDGGTERTQELAPAVSGMVSMAYSVASVESFHVRHEGTWSEVVVGGYAVEAGNIWLPVDVDIKGAQENTGWALEVDYTVEHQYSALTAPLKVAIKTTGEEGNSAWPQIELSPEIDPGVYDLSWLQLIYSYSLFYEEPLVVRYRPDYAEEQEVLDRISHSVYFAMVKDLEDEDLFGQETNVGEYVREAVDDGTLPVGNLSYKTGGTPIEGGVDYSTGEIIWRPTAHYSYSRTKDRAREEFGRIVQTAAFAAPDTGSGMIG